MRFEVPQFIEIEDKIFGPFTWRQFVYLLGGVGIATVLFITTHPFIFVLIGLPIAGLALLLAFYPVNNRPFAVFLESAVQYFNSSRLYLWRKQGTGIYGAAETTTDVESAVVNQNAFTPTVGTQNLASLSRRLELNSLEQK